MFVTGWSCAAPPRVERRLNRAVCTRWHGICPAWLRFVGGCGHVGSDLRLYRWQQLGVDHHGWSCQGLSKDSHSSRRQYGKGETTVGKSGRSSNAIERTRRGMRGRIQPSIGRAGAAGGGLARRSQQVARSALSSASSRWPPGRSPKAEVSPGWSSRPATPAGTCLLMDPKVATYVACACARDRRTPRKMSFLSCTHPDTGSRPE